MKCHTPFTTILLIAIIFMSLQCKRKTQAPPDMMKIPAGTFRMGDITGHSKWDEEKPVHEVTISNPFLLGCTEVTQKQWKEVMGNNPSYFKGDKLPVEEINWYDAVEYCNKRSKMEGLDACYSGSGTSIVCDFAANGYRLPTEAEWEYACRGGTETDFFMGNMTHSGCKPLDQSLDLAGWYCENSDSKTHDVGLKKPNAFGLYDMHGNVWEWCGDFWENKYKADAAIDPRGPSSGNHRILRGGFWSIDANHCRSAGRSGIVPDNRNVYSGFRIARIY